VVASVRTGSSTGGIGSGTLNGSGSLAVLSSSVPALSCVLLFPAVSPPHPEAPKGKKSTAVPAIPIFRKSLREMFIPTRVLGRVEVGLLR
jgi:hypothetical protein